MIGTYTGGSSATSTSSSVSNALAAPGMRSALVERGRMDFLISFVKDFTGVVGAKALILVSKIENNAIGSMVKFFLVFSFDCQFVQMGIR